MNYRHAYHAGNFCDVVKHAVLCRVVDYLKRKEAAFRVIDTHAGAGAYDLSSAAAQKTGEWRGGIERLLRTAPSGEPAALIKPYLDAVRAFNPGPRLTTYPGSPLIVRHLLRRQDRLSAIEKHPEEAAALKDRLAGDFQSRVLELDGWLALGAHLPPKERRGLVLIDPPFEETDEFDRLRDGLARAHRRWPGGAYLMWYPIKDRMAVERFRAGLAETAIARVLDIRFLVRGPSSDPRLDGCGLVAVNPPFTLEAELRTMLPALKTAMAESADARWELAWLAGETGRSE